MNSRNRNAGFSIIEMLVALVILGVALTSILPVFINYANVNRRTEIRAEAVSAAERVMDELRQRDFGDWDAVREELDDGIKVATGDPNTASDDGRTYVPAITWCTADLPLCSNNGGAIGNQQRHVRVAISLDGEEQYSVTTVFTAVN